MPGPAQRSRFTGDPASPARYQCRGPNVASVQSAVTGSQATGVKPAVDTCTYNSDAQNLQGRTCLRLQPRPFIHFTSIHYPLPRHETRSPQSQVISLKNREKKSKGTKGASRPSRSHIIRRNISSQKTVPVRKKGGVHPITHVQSKSERKI